MLAGVTLHNFLLIGFMSLVFSILFKWVAPKTGVRGLADIAKNA